MPHFISVVVPAYGVQGYLGECLDSLLSAPDVDVEVIGVDDASPDHGGVVLDERAAADSRLTVVHLDVNRGPGPARNAGLDRAGGEYVWFVDGDDRIAPGALPVIEARLREAAPDVLVVGVARERWNRSVLPWRSPKNVSTGVDALTRWPPPLGGLIVRRRFLLDAGIAFQPGWYEDLSFAYAVLSAAGSTATIESACYIRRFDRDDSIRTTRSARHVEAVAQYDHILRLPALATAGPQVRRRVLDRAIAELLKIMQDDKRMPPRARRGFFHELSELLRRHEAGAAPRPGGVGGLRLRLIAADSYVAFRALVRGRDLAGNAIGAVRGAPASLRSRLRKRLLPWYYKWQVTRPVDQNLAVYAAYWYRGYACNPAAMYEKAKELAPGVRGVWVVKADAVASLPKGVPYVVPGTRAYYRAVARARYLINNATFPSDVVKREDAVHVQTHHGTPLKTMGLDQPKFPASTVGYNAERLRQNIAKWDFSITANRHTTLLWDRQFPIKGETLEIGYPRNDRLALATPADTTAARAELGIAPGERVVLYAPTHREWHAAFTPVLDVDALAEALGPDTRILLRGHYFYGGIGFPPRHPRVTDVSTYPSVETLYLAADALITDYSSLMFDYAVLDRPLVIFAPDWEVYRAVRGVTFDLAAEPPGVFVRAFDDLVSAFRTGAVTGEEATRARARFRERFCSLEDGHAAERAVRRVLLGQDLSATASRKSASGPDLVPGLVSVIVPIYNVEPFLRDCLDSLRSQTYRRLEVVLVDDGSTDGCAEIAEEFVAADDRFRLIRQANAGLSAARNTGVAGATGEYIAFVDSDDVLAAHAYEVLVRALAGGADFASGGVHRLSSRGHYKGYPHNDAIRATNLEAHVGDNPKLLRDRTVWNKLFRRTFWDRHAFEFPVGRLFEDVPVTVPAHARARKVAIVNETIYFWRVREGAVRSITQSDNDLRNLVDRFHSVNLTRQLLDESGHHELRRVYEEQAIWDKLSNYLKYLPGASAEYRAAFMDLATAYLDEADPGAVERQPARVRRHWELIRERRTDELIELIEQGFRPKAKPAARPRLESGVRTLTWQDGKLEITGYAYVPGGARRRWGSMRLLWLSAGNSRRKLPVRTRSHRDADGRAGAFRVTIDPAALRQGKVWRSGTWTVAVAATSGIRLRRDALRLPVDWTDPMPRRQMAPGVWVGPVESNGRLRLKVTKAPGWLTSSRRDGDDLVLEGRLRGATGPVRIELNRARGLVARSVAAEVISGKDGAQFRVRLPLGDIALDDSTDNHAAGLFAQRFAVHIVAKGKAVPLVAADDYVQTRTVWGTDEVYTTVAVSGGQVSLCTRPAGPVVTEANWRPGGALELRGDSPVPAEGRLLLRLRGRRRDVALPLRVTGGRWDVVVDPSAVPSLAGPLPLLSGTWDFVFRSAGNRHDTMAPLGFADAVRADLPTAAVGPDGTRSVLRPAGNERAILEVEAQHRDPADQERWQKRHFPATDRAALRDVVLFDAAPGRRFADDPAALVAELAARPDAPPAKWTIERGQPVPPGAEPVTLSSEAWYEALATSRWVVTNDDLPRWFRPGRGQVVLRLSGWPIARSGAQAVGHPYGSELIEQITSDAAGWTALASPGPSATPVLRSELRFDGEVLEYGRPANDLLSTVDADQARAEVLRRLDLPPGTRLVLYAPTRRPMDLRKRGWSDPGRLLNLPQVVAALPTGYELLVRRHPGLEDDVLGLAPGVLDVSGHPRVSELLLVADVLITDYSGLLADFALTGRPVLLYVPDLEEFKASPGLNLDLEAAAPGPLLFSSDEVAAAVRDIPSIAAEYEAAAKAFAATHAVGGDGHAARRLVDWLLAASR